LISGPKDDSPSFNVNVDYDSMVEVAEKSLFRVPLMEKAQITRGWAGSYEISPDNHAILGKIPEVEGLYAANGFSGHGFQHSPAAGKLLAELILGEKPSIDFSILSIDRLRKGEYIREAMTAFKD